MNEWPFGNMRPMSYSLIAADPPWKFETYSAKGEGKSPQRHYKCMTLADIQALPVGHLAAPDCALFLWATAPMLPEALDTMKAWGFAYKTHGIWVKTTKSGGLAFGTGYRIRNCHEPFLIGVTGNPQNTKGERSVILSQIREHSRKPDDFYEMCERWLPDAQRAEIFGRQSRPGWDVWGDEAEKFDNSENVNASEAIG